MADLLQTQRNSILTSIYGRRLGIDRNDYLVGPKAEAVQVEDITTTAATSASPYGITRVLTTGSTQLGLYSLQAPERAGVRKTLCLHSTSTGNMQFQLTGANCWASSGASGTTMINLKGNGAVVELLSISTTLWAQINNPSTAQALVLFSTTT